jgi:hypothetical protein
MGGEIERHGIGTVIDPPYDNKIATPRDNTEIRPTGYILDSHEVRTKPEYVNDPPFQAVRKR